MEAALHLLGSVAMVPAVVDDVKNDGAVKMIMSAMDKNANEEEILELGAAALQGLVSSEDGAMEAYVTQIEALTASLVGNPDQTLPIMKTTLNIMNQLALVDGIVTGPLTGQLVGVCGAVINGAGQLQASTMQQEVLSLATQILGRIAQTNEGDVPLHETLSTLLGVVQGHMHNPAIVEGCMRSIGALCQDGESIGTSANIYIIFSVAKYVHTETR